MAQTRYLLDTNVFVNLLRNNSTNVTTRLTQVGIAVCALSEITEAELRVGAEISQRPAYQHALIDQLIATMPVLPITSAIRLYASERARLQASGRKLQDFDLLIGVTAVANGLTVVTNNAKHFDRLPLQIEDWTLENVLLGDLA
ncbi:MAG: type II toxin-antitoxin system VapC family toxin [Hymenobacter sp.]|nr:MAG: type II toxin-antitoxin system VapC family toxin [Hymenobacter sp.]